MADNLHEQLHKYLTDTHSIEVQALAQMKRAPGIAGGPELAQMYEEHERETQEQKRLIEQRLEAHDASPNKLKDIVADVSGIGMYLFAKFNPDSPGKLAAHAHSYEAMEEAAYEYLWRVAERAGDGDTATVARTILEQEKAMKGRVFDHFDQTVEASLREKNADDMKDELVKYLADAHAIEAQAIQMLEAAPKVVGDVPELEKVFKDHLEETQAQQEIIKARLSATGGGPNKMPGGALRLGAVNIGGFFKANPDTPAKLVGFSYAFEHLEIGAYEELKRVADRAGDQETVRIAERIEGEERAAANSLAANWEIALQASLESVGAVA